MIPGARPVAPLKSQIAVKRRTFSHIRHRGLGLLVLPVLLVGTVALPARAADRVTLYYYERPPYSVTDPSGAVSGLVIAPTRAAFERAGIAFTFESTSVKRILELARNDPDPICSPGWYWSAERARSSKFTKPIYRDKPIIGLVRKSFAVPPGISLVDLLARNTQLIVTDGFSYGAYVDALIARTNPKQITHLPSGGGRMIEMVLTGHTDLALTSEEDASSYAKDGIGGPDYPIIHFPDIPSGDPRRIMCSPGVPDEMIERLNQAIDAP